VNATGNFRGPRIGDGPGAAALEATVMRRTRHALTASLITFTLLTRVPEAGAGTVVIDERNPATVSDGILDGFPGTGRPKDGTPDFPGNALAVALQAGVTEERAVVEFPLAALADVAPERVTAATLTFNVDDVLSTFGPGVTFNNQAASTILVHLYDGDGVAALGDFRQTDEDPFRIDTGPGAITDATLNQGGAVSFSLDVRDRLLAALATGTPFLGALWRTNDSPTGTSLDNLGEGSRGPPGARGSRLPFLTIEVDEEPPPPGCGNGTLDAGETCDDGNTDSGDCCSAQCVLDAAGTGCSDGDACTVGDACDVLGACIAGTIPRDCDDANACTVDRCDPLAGCLHDPAPSETALCDDGDPCTTDDFCDGGVCRGAPLCGNGVVNDSCGEECDDGNFTPADGCSAACRFDTLTGGRGHRECILEVAFVAPVRTRKGAVARKQVCRDNDPACDDDPAEGTCGFLVGACLGRPDPRIPACEADDVPVVTSVVRPGSVDTGSDGRNRERLDAMLAEMASPGCAAPVRIEVPLRQRGTKRRTGASTITLRAEVPGGLRDRDSVRFVCRPPLR
jgi:cysteine-rich repeat protein